MITVAIMTGLCLVAAVLGVCFLEGKYLEILLKILGLTIWGILTFWWWFNPLLKRWLP